MIKFGSVKKEHLVGAAIGVGTVAIRFSTDIERILKYSNVEENTANQIIGLLVS